MAKIVGGAWGWGVAGFFLLPGCLCSTAQALNSNGLEHIGVPGVFRNVMQLCGRGVGRVFHTRQIPKTCNLKGQYYAKSTLLIGCD